MTLRGLLLLFALPALAVAPARGDTFLLIGGGRLYGRLEREYAADDGRAWLSVRSAFGTVQVPKAQVERILPYERDDRTIYLEEIQVTQLAGTVEKSSDGGATWTALALAEGVDRRTLLRPGDVLRTGEDGEVDLAIGLGVVHVAPRSQLTFQARRGATLRLDRGEFSTKVDDVPKGEDFKVRTPQGVLGVKGTTFLVRAGERTRVAVEDGRVQTGWGRVDPGRALETDDDDRGIVGDLSAADRASFDRLRLAAILPRFENVFIPGGEFTMGSDAPGSRREERPAHPVRVRSFLASRFEVTNAQYAVFVRWIRDSGDHSYCHPDEPAGKTHRPSREAPGGDLADHPVEGVDWYDAYAFCSWVGGSLPTEAQWEYACRAGTTGRYYFGDSSQTIGEHAWYGENAGRATHPVGRKRANPWGLHDLFGNATEWCLDSWHPDYAGAPSDGSAWMDPASRRWVIRGGSWMTGSYHLRSTTRDSLDLDSAANGGIRPVWNLD